MAVVAVLLVLMALLILCAPFLLTVGNADKASTQMLDRASARIALDDAARHARARLGVSHPALDLTPYWDSEDELAVPRDLDPEWLDPTDPTGTMWSHDVVDVSGLVDLNSAPPQMMANVLGTATRLGAPLKRDSDAIVVSNALGFPPEGFLWVAGELIGYGGVEANQFTTLLRGLGVQYDDEGKAYPCGPRPAQSLPIGTLVTHQDVWAVARWRINGPEGMRGFDSIEQVRDSKAFALSGGLSVADLLVLERTGSVFAGVGGGPEWQKGARLIQKVVGGPTGCGLRVDEARWFNAGTTVRVTDGRTTEYGLVKDAGQGVVVLTQPLANDYEAFTAVVQPQARRPVNVNTAPAEVLYALVHNLQIKGRSSRISKMEAEELVAVMVESRPFEGLEDFLERVVLPAAGLEPLPRDAPVIPAQFADHAGFDPTGGQPLASFLDEDDARALYKNALNANDGELAFSTMPFSFVSRDVYRMDLRSGANARSQVSRATARREEVERVVPQRSLLQVWSRQEDFEESIRMTRDGAGWATGPNPVARFDPLHRAETPSRARAHLGPHDTFPSTDPLSDDPGHTFPARDEDEQPGFAQLWAARADEEGRRAGRALHFDHETRDLEGRRLDDGPVALGAADGRVLWNTSGGFMRPLTFSAWVKPMELTNGMRLLDVGGPYNETDRVSLLFDGSDLVLRVLDAAGDHPESAFVEQAELRYELATGDGPGLPLDTWTHVEVDVRGNRPDQMTMRVDGKAFARTMGQTRLTSALASGAQTILVESTEGFPDRCTIRIADELIEVEKAGPSSFSARYETIGETAGFGGRIARTRMQEVTAGGASLSALPMSLPDDQHASGATVTLYGYGLPVSSNVPSVETTLTSSPDQFHVGYVTGIQRSGSVRQQDSMEPILLQGAFAPFVIGWGMDGLGDDVEGLELAPADATVTSEQLMAGFSSRGGYAAILSLDPRITNTNDPGAPAAVQQDVNGTRLGGIEVIHYTGVSGNVLLFDRRGDNVGELSRIQDAQNDPDIAGRGSFPFYWQNWLFVNGVWVGSLLRWQTMVIPISLDVASTGGIGGFLVPGANAGQDSELAQITRVGAEAHLTEWVRYDEVLPNHLVRTDPEALRDARLAAHAEVEEEDATGGGPPPPILPPPTRLVAGATGSPAGAGPAQSPQVGGQWQHYLGTPEDDDHIVSRAVRQRFQFRGVMGTFPHAHPSGTRVVPVWRVNDAGNDGGQPGRFDHVHLLDGDPTAPGWSGVVHHAHRPFNHVWSSWSDGGNLTATAAIETTVPTTGVDVNAVYVALRERLPVPIAAGSSAPTTPGQVLDPRLVARVSSFPSGERPRQVDSVAVGGSYQGGGGEVPAAVVDEIQFADARFGESIGFGDWLHGGQMRVAQEFGATDTDFQVEPSTIRASSGSFFAPNNHRWLNDLRNYAAEDAGLMRIGDEILCYESYTADTGAIFLAEGGRGLLGTDSQPHLYHEPVSFLEHVTVSVLTGGIGPDDAWIPLASTEEFPTEGLVLIDDELIHYSFVSGGALGMPRRSEVPGAMDGKGPALFRGRFGTDRRSHAGGTPVILFPFRYWDRWTDRADAPELHQLGVTVDQQDAFWSSVFFQVEEPAHAGPRFGLLARTDPSTPWDADPDAVPGLELFTNGMPGGKGNGLGVQADAADLRFFVRYEPGAFDPIDGLNHGWKTTPRLMMFGVEYYGPGAVLRRLAR